MKPIRKLYSAASVLFSLSVISACSAGGGADINMTDMSRMSSMSYTLDFDNEQIVSRLNTKPLGDSIEWRIEAIGRAVADSEGKIVNEDEKAVVAYRYGAAVPDGAYDLVIGEDGWSDYSAAFDFLMSEGGEATVEFGIYDNTLKTDTDMGECGIKFSLTKEGRLFLQTVPFLQYGYEICAEGSESPFIGNLDPNVWNRIELTPENGSLILSLNGTKAGALCGLKEHEYGRFSLCGGSGCMFRNISAEGNKEAD